MLRPPRTPQSLRRFRVASAAIAVISLATFIFTVHREAGVQLHLGVLLSCGDACLKIGLADPTDRPRSIPQTWFMSESFHPDWAIAWRPFHVRVPMGFGRLDSNYLAIPLWPVMLLSLMATAWAQGRLSGIGRGLNVCRSCGYDLTGCPIENHSRRCPECGTKSAAIGNA